MDYGKLAYLKALDLEGRLSDDGERLGVWQNDVLNIASGRVFVACIEGYGDIAVFIDCSVQADFYIDDRKVASGKTVFFGVKGGDKIYVESNGAEKLHIMALGRVGAIRDMLSVTADSAGGDILVVVNRNGSTTAYVYDITYDVMSDQRIISYQQGDCCLWDKKYVFVFVDAQGNIDIYANFYGRRIEAGASKVAVSADDGGMYVAYLKDGGLYYFVLENLQGAFSPVKLEYNKPIDDVRMVKKSSGLLFSSGGKCFYKDLGFSDRVKDKVYVKIHGEVA